MKIAVLVDGGYYRKRSQNVFGKVTAKERADELYKYCNRHLKETHFGIEKYADLYRIFYYDCPPIDKQVFHPLTQTNIDFTKSETKQWTGLDIATLSYKKLVDKIVLIAGDSDFVPAAKLARTEGIDFVLDSLGADIRDSLSLHIDGRRTCDEKYINRNRQSKKDTL